MRNIKANAQQYSRTIKWIACMALLQTAGCASWLNGDHADNICYSWFESVNCQPGLTPSNEPTPRSDSLPVPTKHSPSNPPAPEPIDTQPIQYMNMNQEGVVNTIAPTPGPTPP